MRKQPSPSLICKLSQIGTITVYTSHFLPLLTRCNGAVFYQPIPPLYTNTTDYQGLLAQLTYTFLSIVLTLCAINRNHCISCLSSITNIYTGFLYFTISLYKKNNPRSIVYSVIYSLVRYVFIIKPIQNCIVCIFIIYTVCVGTSGFDYHSY